MILIENEHLRLRQIQERMTTLITTADSVSVSPAPHFIQFISKEV